MKFYGNGYTDSKADSNLWATLLWEYTIMHKQNEFNKSIYEYYEGNNLMGITFSKSDAKHQCELIQIKKQIEAKMNA